MTISEIAKKYDISSYTLRYYEKIGLIDPVMKDQSGHRQYSDKDDYRIAFLVTMRKAGMSIESLQEFVRLYNEGPETIPARQKLLHEQLRILDQKAEEINKTRAILLERIAYYDCSMLERDTKARALEQEINKSKSEKP